MTLDEEVERDAEIAYERHRVSSPAWAGVSEDMRRWMREQQRAVLEARYLRELEEGGY